MNQNIKNFLEEESNKEALRLLLHKIKELDTVHGVESYTELQANKKAIDKIESWVEELFGVSREELRDVEEDEDPLYRYRTEE